jgi:acyl-CoA thioesterase I
MPLAKLFSAALFALLAGCAKTPTLPALGAGDTVLAFGDSLTFGIGAAPEQSYPARLAALIGRKVVNAGVPGEVSADGLRRLPEAIEEHQPKLLILCHGGNDFLRKLGDEAAATNLRAMIRHAQSKGIAVVLMATPKPGLSVSPPAFYADIAREFALPFDDSVVSKVLSDSGMKSDLVHPNAQGYARMAEALAALLKKAKAI